MTDRPAQIARPGRSETRFLLLLIAGGILLRLIWLIRVQGGMDVFPRASEATDAALSIARTGTLGNIFFAGQGPSAHLMPVSPMIAGGIMRLFGPGSTAADLTLLSWSLIQVMGAYLLYRLLFARMGSDAATLRWGSALLFLLIPFVPQEVIDFRYWEGALAAVLAAANLILILDMDRTATLNRPRLIMAALLSAATFMVSPAVALAVDCCWGMVALRRLPFRRAMLFAAASAIALAVMVAPWAIRNQRELGNPILTRSNFGLELAIANYPGALNQDTPARSFSDRIDAIHPAANAQARALVRLPAGESGYSHMLAQRTIGWIEQHPGDFARLWMRHLGQYFFPRPWQFYFSEWEGMRTARSLTVTTVSFLGLLGMGLGLIRRRRGYGILLLYLVVIAFPYAAFQPVPRYSFLIWGLLAFPAAEAVLAAIGAVRRRLTLHNQTSEDPLYGNGAGCVR
ncbi:hypothetical protein GCM10023219_05070 [Stakelama sediminis]|uniref:Dolichyl-phosphate-mannose-protein mannosyltransferase n=1 Tax=Stakelama sediminis TaxID=463200 RepID=A0A840YUJ9_9SPHN|nr:hypothetical protein [Stakelama sediminis]MBB5717224.1 hypothetical protein [Stakelama sediminis]